MPSIARGRGSGRHEDVRRVTEHPRHVRDRATVVAVGRGDECERTQRCERGAQLVDVAPLRLVTEPGDEQPVDGPGCAEDLERRHAEALRLVLHDERGDSERVRELGRVDDPRGRVPRQAAMELERRVVRA